MGFVKKEDVRDMLNVIADSKAITTKHGAIAVAIIALDEMDTKPIIDTKIQIPQIVNKIASFFEQEDNWKQLIHDCWLIDGKSDDLRNMLYKALSEANMDRHTATEQAYEKKLERMSAEMEQMRLIDVDVLISWLKKVARFLKDCENHKIQTKLIGQIINHIEKTPAVDPESLRPQGEWIRYHEADLGWDEWGYRCSNCKWEVEDEKITFPMNYCPNCGAKMKEK